MRWAPLQTRIPSESSSSRRIQLVAVVEIEVLPNARVASVGVLVEVPAIEVLYQATRDDSVRGRSCSPQIHSLVHVILAQAAA